MAKEYIEREALIEEITKSKMNNPHTNDKQRQMHVHEHRHFLCMVNIMQTADVVEVVHGKWEMYLCDEDALEHHQCSVCENFALFSYENETIWDENSDGDIVECGEFTSGINEYLTPYCPICGAKMDGERKEV